MLSLKFLYKNPVGSLITNEKLSNNSAIVRAILDPNLEDDPQRAEYVRSIPKALLYKNFLLQGYLVSPKVLKKIENFEVRHNDVWLITYPKSGTTWTEEILSLIYNNGDLKKVKEKLLPTRVPHLEVGRPLGHMRWLNNLKSPRLLATHLPIDCIPKQLKQTKCKIIYVIRNPKDNAVSYYHHHRMSTFLGNYKGKWDDFLELFIKGHLVYGDWFQHIKGYWDLAQQYPNRILFISYEEMKINLPKMIGLIADFVGKSLSDETINKIAKHCSFDEMKANTMVNREVLPIPDLFDMSQTKFMRKGIIGDWKNYFTQQQNEQFDKLYDQKMQGLGLTLSFDSEDALYRMQNYGRIICQSDAQPNEVNFNELYSSKILKPFNDHKCIQVGQQTIPQNTENLSFDVRL